MYGNEKLDWYMYFILAMIMLYFYSLFSAPIEKIFIGFWIYYSVYNGLVGLISSFVDKETLPIKILKFIVGFPFMLVKVVFISWYSFLQISLFLVIIFGIIPTIVMRIISEKYYLGALYLGVLFSVIFFAYLGEYLWGIIKKFYGNKNKNRLIKKTSNIIIVYIVMISVYIIYNFVNFSGIYVTYFGEMATFLILKEVLVTFIAIDGLRQLIKKGNLEKA